MGVPYKLQRRRNPQKPDEPGQWHAVPKTGKAVDEKIMTRMATDDTTMADFELSSAAKLIGKFIHKVMFDELIETLDLPEAELRQFADDVLERFVNPYVKHFVTSIMLNSFPRLIVTTYPL